MANALPRMCYLDHRHVGAGVPARPRLRYNHSGAITEGRPYMQSQTDLKIIIAAEAFLGLAARAAADLIGANAA
jgi:hypothetical protein